MTMFAVGARVRLKATTDIFNLGVFPAHTAGTVIEADGGLPDGYIAVVELDDHFAMLNEWSNCLFVYRDGDAAEITEDLFEPCGF